MDLISTIYPDNNIIEEVDSFLFNMPEEYALGHCVSKDMRMSAGIALQFKSTFGRVGELMDQKSNVGDVAYLQQNNRYIYYLITKERSFRKPTYESLTAAITKLRDFIVKHGVKKLVIPRIGCGLDKLEWLQVKTIIKTKFKDVKCVIKVCHFSENMTSEKEIPRIDHPNVIKSRQDIKEIDKRIFEKLNFILYSRKTTLPVYWDQSFQSVDEKHHFKSKYYEDYQVDLKVGKCLHYDTTEANVYVIFTNENTTAHFSYQNLEIGLIQIKHDIVNNQWPTFIIQRINNPMFEKLINPKIVSLICSSFLELTPCVIIETENSSMIRGDY